MKNLGEVLNVIYKIFRRKKKQALCGLLFTDVAKGSQSPNIFCFNSRRC